MAAYGSAGAVLGVAALMLLLPVASATIITKPFHGWTSGISYSVSQSGCSHAKQTKIPTWHKLTGVFQTGGTAKSPACRSSPSANSAYWGGSLNLNGNLKFLTSGTHNVTVTWKLAMAEAWSLTPFSGCTLNYAASFSTCAAYAEVSIFSYIFITDTSNSTWGTYGYGYAIGGFLDYYNYTSSQNYSENFAGSHYGGNFSYGNNSGSFTGTTVQSSMITLSGTSAINKTDKYTAQIYFSVGADTGAYIQNAKAVGSASAAASVNMAGAAYGATLGSISIT